MSSNHFELMTNYTRAIARGCRGCPCDHYPPCDSERDCAHMERELQLRQSLRCTRACTNTLPDSKGNWGCCTRVHCDFAHSLQELRFPPCKYGEQCNRQYTCPRMHPGESRDSFIARAKPQIPNLPQTDELTRRPPQRAPDTPLGLTVELDDEQPGSTEWTPQTVQIGVPGDPIHNQAIVNLSRKLVPNPEILKDILQTTEVLMNSIDVYVYTVKFF